MSEIDWLVDCSREKGDDVDAHTDSGEGHERVGLQIVRVLIHRFICLVRKGKWTGLRGVIVKGRRDRLDRKQGAGNRE